LLRFARKDEKRRRAGFTLVEVIVVLVILAILAAIAIPALTGYIKKAQDKQYVMMARDYVTATKAVLDEAYATGELSKNDPSFLNDGNPNYSSYLKYFGIMTASYNTFGDYVEMQRKAGGLVAKKFPAGASSGAGYWQIIFIGSTTSTLFNADGFLFWFYPEGNNADGDPVIAVTYKVNHFDNVKTNRQLSVHFYSDAKYDPKAGYEVYDMVVGGD
jgi:prepilin-type N-terminal cleavage/methylation domain-containing protein